MSESKNNIPLLRASDIEVRVGQVTKAGALALLYKTARTDRKYLNTIYGPLNWTSDYREIKGNLYCGIGVRQDPDHDFVWKWDCGIESRADGDGNEKKGEASDAFKRAGYQWGIGEELYSSPNIWLSVATKPKNDGKGYVLENPYSSYVVSEIEYNEEEREITKLVIVNESTHVVVYSWEANTTHAKTQIKAQEATPKQIPTKPVAQPAQTQPTQTVETKSDKKTLSQLKDAIEAIVKQMRNDGKLNEYKDIATINGSLFSCKSATDDQYGIVLEIYNKLLAKGYKV